MTKVEVMKVAFVKRVTQEVAFVEEVYMSAHIAYEVAFVKGSEQN